MSKKDIDRSSQWIFRNGVRIPRHVWDRQNKKIEEAKEHERLVKLGLVRGETGIVTPEELKEKRNENDG